MLRSAGREHDLADALARIEVKTRDAVELDPGDLVVLVGRPHGNRLVEAQLLERWPCPEPRGDGEFARLALTGLGARLRARALALREVRSYFTRRGFIEVETPLLGSSPGFDSHVEGMRAEGGWLATSPEQAMKRLLVGGMPRIFQVCHSFRGDEQGPWHQPEFSILEWYRAFSEFELVLRDTEQIVARVARALRGRPELVLPDGRRLDATPPYPRITVREAFRRHAPGEDPIELSCHNEERFYRVLVTRVEPALATLPSPVWLSGYPLCQAALARPSREDPEVAERYELYAGGVELCNGFAELTDPVEHDRRRRRVQADRHRRGQRPQPVDRRFMQAVREGLPPSAGNALGLDRLLALVLGISDISQLQAIDVKQI